MPDRPTPNYYHCPCCNGHGAVANQDCCSGCCGTKRMLNAPEVCALGGGSEHAGSFYVRRAAHGFPNGPGSCYLHHDGSWHPSTNNDKGEFPGLFLSETAARATLATAH